MTLIASPSENVQKSSRIEVSICLARGGALTLDYSNDGAKDLTAATWPAMNSGPFTIPALGHSYEYNRSGQIKTHSDPSGTRSLAYQNGRMSGSLYTAGVLKGYQIIPGRDEFGRQTGTLLKRDGNTIHTTIKALNGVSDQVTNLASDNITATPQRNAAGNITGYIWSDGTNSVTQTWTRGAGGRIESADSNVAGAPEFDYAVGENSFDAFGRRLKCETAGGTWTYTYGAGGQLSSAVHPTLGTFNYAFDGIGRRTDKGSANTNDILNRTTAWAHTQNQTLSIKAHPDARVWFNGVEIENFNGTHNAAITPPGAEGGWVPWETLAVLEGAGEGAGNPAQNPLADPDAKSEKQGAVWVPPTAETFTFDAAGNRESSAQFDYGWDAKNQLARVRTKNHTTAAQAYDITFTYDSEGRRVKKHVVEFQNGSVVSEKIITFVWDGWDLLYERHQLPSGLTLLERKYLWGPDIANGAAGGVGGLLLIRETKGSVTINIIPLYDGTGHVVALTDINKNILATYAYGPFGERIHATGPKAQSNPWRWTTKYLDEETGLYYFGKRYHDPITGQFISRDPLGEDESHNLYGYGHGDPINHVDVQGMAAVLIVRNETNYEHLKLLQENGWERYKGVTLIKAYDHAGVENLWWKLADRPETTQWKDSNGHNHSIGKITGTEGIWFFDNQDHASAIKNVFDSAIMTAVLADVVSTCLAAGTSGLGGMESFANVAKSRVAPRLITTFETIDSKGGVNDFVTAPASVGRAEAGVAIQIAERRASNLIGEDFSSAAGMKVWRNVPDGHGAFADAQAGIVKPYGPIINEPLDVRALGHDSGNTFGSGLSSWSADKNWVLARQKNLGGVVLETLAPEGSVWYNVAGKNTEAQILIEGAVKATKIK